MTNFGERRTIDVKLREAVAIKSIWSNEPAFSDYLASEEGIKLIGQDLEIELENPRRECIGSDFHCDIVANKVGDDRHAVIIENQFGRTDHDHLGKFLTYAASHNALTCVWIAERITDDHRGAVDWLNNNTPENFSFYAVELKAFRIGDSAVTPVLQAICKPNLQVKISKSSSSESQRETDEWRRQLWESIHEALRQTSPAFRLQKASADAWSSITLGRSNYHMNMLLTPSRGVIGLETIFQGPHFEAWYDFVSQYKDQIEGELGQVLQWVPKRGEKSAKVMIETSIQSRDEIQRQDAIRWFCDFVPRWHRAFSKYSSQLPLESPSGGGTSNGESSEAGAQV